MLSFDLNWLAILVSVVANMGIGAIWFGVFANPWLEGIGKTREDIQEAQSWQPFGVAVVNSLLMAIVLANVINWAGATGLVSGLVTGLLTWIGFTGFSFAANHAFEGRTLKLWAVNSGSYLVGLLVMGAVLGAWQ